ncbi:MAG: hypothetical protein PQ612_10775 [Rickettsiales bacterium]|nr:hypothetical protein [Pseudomonadota bacterium]MDA0966709.1 hypothetical protein [Pseudomonadota bacterium]MDG4544480.1 hypothetical protein [Rickettsiales bacterium]MDG4546632.1 hypothetical protein [Rickettsiales bacterium]MDG4548779.1 hypothetical protein [Rickettsiales bacterium]
MIDALSFSDAVDIALKDNANHNQVLVLGDIPEVYLSLGVPNLKLIMLHGTLLKIIEKHSLTINSIKRLPALLKEPIMVFSSATETGSLIAIVDEYDCSGNTVIAVINPDWQNKRHKVNKIASVYGKSRLRWFAEQIEAGRLLYSDKEKALRWSQSTRLQLPREVIAAEHGLIIPSNQPKVKNNNHSKPILTLKNKGKNHEN